MQELEGRGGTNQVLVHTGQHYDYEMSATFFDDLGIPAPDENLGVGSGTHAEQTAGVMTEIEPVIGKVKPECLVVVGDVNSTIAAALTATKLGVPVAHVESGLRSGDRSMPEEINRILTDQISEYLFTHSHEANENLREEGIPDDRIHFVGNIMIDSLESSLARSRELDVVKRFGLTPGKYALATLHRPSNVDREAQIAEILDAFDRIANVMPLIFPVHPRTRERMEAAELRPERVTLTAPVGYLEMLALMESAAVVLTDSGGIQEETTALGIPCITLRDSTERPVTITKGTNRLLSNRSSANIVRAFRTAREEGAVAPEHRPEFWDGRTAARIANVLLAKL
jgi:UDP-N-acetylglucosamine 2-epimerase (non-hydrolysing)